jgi:hypothetical protein
MKPINIISTVLALMMFLLTGCSTFKPATQGVTINTTPGNARLLVNGQTYTSPATVQVRRNKPVHISASKEGHYPASEVIGHHMSPEAKADIVVGLFLFWPSLLGLFSAGARDLDKTNVNLHLPRNESALALRDQDYRERQRFIERDKRERRAEQNRIIREWQAEQNE